MVYYALRTPFAMVRGAYGGSQMWHQDKRLVQTGCGPVALANIFAFYRFLNLSVKEMTDLQVKVTDYLKGPVFTPWQFISGTRKLFGKYGIGLDADVIFSFSSERFSYIRAVELIKRELLENRPVMILTGPDRPFKKTFAHDFRNHWVTVTALTVTEKETVTVSSWGTQYQLDLKRLLDSKIFMAVIAIRPEIINRQQKS